MSIATVDFEFMLMPSSEAPVADHDAVRNSTIDLLGGARVVKQAPKSVIEVHDTVARGLPTRSLERLLSSLTSISLDDVGTALGTSTRTIARQRDRHGQPLSTELSSKTWQLAEVLAKATLVFGGQPAAEQWLVAPAMALDGKRPVALLATAQGATLVIALLERLEYGVYN